MTTQRHTEVGAMADSMMSVIAPLSSLARKTYKATIFEALRELIQRLEIPPGERLVEADLAARFGVSKTPVREALLLLEREHLVTAVPHVGATVTWLSLPDYEQKLFILDALEQPTLQLVLKRITPEELARCQRIMQAMAKAHGEGDEPAYLENVLQMHSQLFAAARYPQLTELVNGMQQSMRRHTKAFVHRYPDNWQRELDTAMQRFEHLRQGDVAGAASAVQRGHAAMLEFARRRVEAHDPTIIRYIDPQTIEGCQGTVLDIGAAAR